MTDIPPLPAGFQLDGPKPSSRASTPALPAGFQLEQPAAAAPTDGPAVPPSGLRPGTREYASWAAQQARAGRKLPQVSQHQTTESSVLDPLVQGLTLGWGDEMRGAVQGGIAAAKGGDFGNTYAQVVDDGRNSLNRERRVNPIGSIAAELAGGIGTGVLAAPVIAPVAGLGNAGRTLPMWQQIARGGLVAAPGGMVYGAGASGDSAQERGAGALLGGAAAAAGGAAAPVVLRGVGAAASAVGNRLATSRAARQAGYSPEAVRFASETLQADDTLGAGTARMAAAGDERMIADAGPSALNLMDFAIQSSGKAGRVAGDAVGQRVSRSATSIQNALDSALGRPTGIQTARANIRTSTAAARSAAYDGPGGAYDTPIDYSAPAGRKLEELLQRVDQSDIKAANDLMRAEGKQSQQILARVADDGVITYQRMPDVRQIDYITRALRDRVDASATLGKLGGQTNAGRVYGNLAGDLRDATRESAPAYGVALDTAADPIRRSQAIEFGAKVLRPSTPRDEVINELARMTGPERDAVKQGIRSQIDETLSNVTRTVQDGDTPAREAIAALRQMSSRANREKLTAIMGKSEADRLFTEIDRAATSFDLRAGVANNSKTFQRQEMGRRAVQTTAPDGPIATIMRGEPLNAGKRAVQMLTGQTPEAALQRQDEVMTEVVQMLTARGFAADEALAILKSLGSRLQGGQGVADAFRIGGERAAIPTGTSAEQIRQMSGR